MDAFVREFPDRNWNWEMFTWAPWLTKDFVEEFSNKDFGWHSLSRRPFFDLEMVLKFRHKNLDWQSITDRDYVTPEVVVQHRDLLFCQYSLLSKPWMNIEFIIDNPWLQLNWLAISRATFVTKEAFLKYPHLPWVHRALVIQPWMTIEIMDSLPGEWKHWTNISLEQLINRPDLHDKLNWKTISKSSWVTWEIIEEHPDWPWDWDAISTAKWLTAEIVIDNDKPWNFSNLVLRGLITVDMIRMHPHKDWDWDLLGQDKTFILSMYSEPSYANLEIQLAYHNAPSENFLSALETTVIPRTASYKLKDLLNLNEHRPVDWYPSCLFAMTFLCDTTRDARPKVRSFMQINKALPFELRKLICCMVYRQRSISKETERMELPKWI